MQEWEYWVEETSYNPEDDLSRLGASGWELVAVVFSEGIYRLFFKRPRY